ncbi:MAG: serpin family protein [Eubacterium sp.]|nr:serpin family protein [Eubacterium sp.]
MKKRNVLALLFVLVFLFSSFGASAAEPTGGTKNLTSTLKIVPESGRDMNAAEAKKLTSASIKLLNNTIKYDKKDANVLISPTSIMFAFGLAENAARGRTKKQMEDIINGGLKTADNNQVLCKLMRDMESDENVEWNVANSVWLKDSNDVKVKDSYLRTVGAYYDADIFKAPFDPSTVEDINGWVNTNTNQMIPKIIEELDKSAVACLINAIAFEASWQEPFNDYQIVKDADFINSDKSISKVNMLCGKESGYFNLNGANGFKKLYKGGDYAFVGIEMPEGTSTADYISKLSKNPSSFNKALSNMKYDKDVRIKMPEYQLDYDIEMSDMLKKAGITDAFDKNRADLYNMFVRDPGSNYYFDKVIHKTHIEVDKNGTKAAAATAIIMIKATSVQPIKEPLDINLDHAFVYAIIDTKNNTPVFIGCVNSLQK